MYEIVRDEIEYGRECGRRLIEKEIYFNFGIWFRYRGDGGDRA